eukprot:gene6983-7532_t
MKKLVNEFTYRKPAKQTSIRLRFKSLSSNEQVMIRSLEKAIKFSVVKGTLSVGKDQFEKERERTKKLIKLLMKIKIDPQPTPSPPPRLKTSINNFDESYLKNTFKFSKLHLRRLLELLNLPKDVSLSNRSKMTGEEVFLRGLYELSTGETKYNICENVFGRSCSDQSRAFSWFINYIYDNFHHLVHDNLPWWFNSGFLHLSADAIGGKIGRNDNNISLFIDCNCLETSRPGGGPREEGSEAARWHNDIQRAFYNGWKSVHGLKHQTVDNAYGMTVDMFGPTSLRRNDLALLRDSSIHNRIASIQEGNERQLIMFGDSIYLNNTHLKSYCNDENFNKDMKATRISIEWNYSVSANLFNYIANYRKLRLLESNVVSKIYTVVTLFRNFHIACYGGQTSNYFDLVVPIDMLERYIKQL